MAGRYQFRRYGCWIEHIRTRIQRPNGEISGEAARPGAGRKLEPLGVWYVPAHADERPKL